MVLRSEEEFIINNLILLIIYSLIILFVGTLASVFTGNALYAGGAVVLIFFLTVLFEHRAHLFSDLFFFYRKKK